MEYSEITSRKNSLIVQTAKLSDKKERDKQNLFCADGYKLLEEAIDAKLNIKKLFFTQSALNSYGKLIENTEPCDKYLVADEVFEKLTAEKAPQGILTCIRKPLLSSPTSEDINDGGFIILDSVQNPLNLGAIVRSAYALGASRIVLTNGCADPFGPKALRAAMGSLFKAKLYYVNQACEIINLLNQNSMRTICTRLCKDAYTLGRFDFCDSDSIVIGNEGHGVSQATANSCTHSLYIPMVQGAESLNAGAASAIAIWEMKKSRLI